MFASLDYCFNALNLIIFVFGIIANLFTIFIVIKFGLTRHALIILILNLSIADSFSLCRIPFIVYENIIKNWAFGFTMCKAYPAYILTSSSASCFTIVTITIER
ncbi:hypothetical protein B4U79_02161, partial [Dinothrombium tinctorium]